MLVNIREFLDRIEKRTSSNDSVNPYLNPLLLVNLEKYLYYYLKNKVNILFIGEAPGRNGCALSGIPFTSCEVINNNRGTYFFDDLTTISNQAEASATIVWSTLRLFKNIPLMWNSFPFYPHHLNNKEKMRTPSNLEIEEGTWYINKILEIYNPSRIYAVGRKSEESIKRNFSHLKGVEYIRHPSHGGSRPFTIKAKEILKIYP